MTDEQIETLAIRYEAFGFGRVDEHGLTTHGFDPDGLRSFARAIRAAEQERCAMICKEYANRHAKDDNHTKAQAWMMLQCAAAIRANPSPSPTE